jgi:hypothetical protein
MTRNLGNDAGLASGMFKLVEGRAIFRNSRDGLNRNNMSRYSKAW